MHCSCVCSCLHYCTFTLLFSVTHFSWFPPPFFLVCLMQVVILTMFTLITLFSTIIPISLYVSIEVISIVWESTLHEHVVCGWLSKSFGWHFRGLNFYSPFNSSTMIWICIMLKQTHLHWLGHQIWMKSLDRYSNLCKLQII